MAKTKLSVTVAGKTSTRTTEKPYQYVLAAVADAKWLYGRESKAGAVFSWHHTEELANAALRAICTKTKSQVNIIMNPECLQVVPVNG